MKQTGLFLLIFFTCCYQAQIISSDLTRFGGNLSDYAQIKVISKTYSDAALNDQQILDFDLNNLVRKETKIEKDVQFDSYWVENLKDKSIEFYYVQFPNDTIFRQINYYKHDFQDSITITERPQVVFISSENFYDDENRLIKNVKYNGDTSIFKTFSYQYEIDGNCTTTFIDFEKDEIVCKDGNLISVSNFRPVQISDFGLNFKLPEQSKKLIFLNQKSMVKRIEFRNPNDKLISELDIIYIK